MVKFAHMSNYSNLIGLTIFKCGSGYHEKSQSTVIRLVGFFILFFVSAFVCIFIEVKKQMKFI